MFDIGAFTFSLFLYPSEPLRSMREVERLWLFMIIITVMVGCVNLADYFNPTNDLTQYPHGSHSPSGFINTTRD